MATARNGGAAAAPGANSPTSDEAPAGRTAQGFKGQAQSVFLDCRVQPASGQAARRTIKHLIVLAACWGFPAAWAQWLIERGGLSHE